MQPLAELQRSYAISNYVNWCKRGSLVSDTPLGEMVLRSLSMVNKSLNLHFIDGLNFVKISGDCNEPSGSTNKGAYFCSPDFIVAAHGNNRKPNPETTCFY